MSDVNTMNIEQLRDERRSLKINIAQKKDSLTKLQARLAEVNQALAASVPVEMTKDEIESALGYRVKLMPAS